METRCQNEVTTKSNDDKKRLEMMLESNTESLRYRLVEAIELCVKAMETTPLDELRVMFKKYAPGVYNHKKVKAPAIEEIKSYPIVGCPSMRRLSIAEDILTNHTEYD